MSSQIKELIKKKGFTQEEVAAALGVTKQAVSYWCSDKFVPRANKAKKLAELLGVTPTSLVFNDGNLHPALTEDENTVSIPCLNITASYKLGDSVQNAISMVKLLKVSKNWLRSQAPFANFSALNIITADGDSMVPTIKEGDIILIDTSQKTFRSDAIYAFIKENDIYIKRIQRIGNGIRVISDNSSFYPPFEITENELENVKIIGRAYCIGQFKNV